MGEQKESVIFVANNIPNTEGRAKYQHAVALSKAFETTVLSRREVPSQIRRTAYSVRTYPESALSSVPFGFPVWLTFWSFWIRAELVVTNPGGFYVIITFVTSRLSNKKCVVDYWDDLTFPAASYEQQSGIHSRLMYLYHRLSARLAAACLARIDLLILSIHPGVINKYELETVRVIELTNGYRPELLTHERQTNTDGQTTFIYLGKANAKRGIDEVIRTVAGANNGEPLDIVGPTDTAVERAAAEYDNVTLHGEKPYAEALNIVSRADIGLCVLDTTVENYQYSFPIKLFEYAALGKAIIASDTPAIRSVLTDGESAALVEGDAELTAAVNRLTTDSRYRQRLGEKAYKQIQPYSWSEILDQYTDEIRDVMKS